MMAAIGLPGLNGFIGEFLILLGTFLSHRWWAVAGATGVVAAAIYLLWAFQRAFHHRPDEANAKVADLSWGERAIMLPLVAFIVFLGIYPRPVLERITPSVDAVLTRVERGGSYVVPKVAAASHAARPVTLASAGGRGAADRGRQVAGDRQP
jgi:NADH-quinone oxidoreductase subunit M